MALLITKIKFQLLDAHIDNDDYSLMSLQSILQIL